MLTSSRTVPVHKNKRDCPICKNTTGHFPGSWVFHLLWRSLGPPIYENSFNKNKNDEQNCCSFLFLSVNYISQVEIVWSSQHGIFVFNKSVFSFFCRFSTVFYCLLDYCNDTGMSSSHWNQHFFIMIMGALHHEALQLKNEDGGREDNWQNETTVRTEDTFLSQYHQKRFRREVLLYQYCYTNRYVKIWLGHGIFRTVFSLSARKSNNSVEQNCRR